MNQQIKAATSSANTFLVGRTYSTPSIVDADFMVTLTVLRRTAKTISANVRGQVKTLRISDYYDGAEMVMPWGNYSMAPIITARDAA